MDIYDTALIVGAITTGMMAGLLFVFSTTVMPAIRALPAASGLAAMQTINRRITEPLFGLIVVGGIASSVLAVVLGFGDLGERVLAIAAGLIYLVGFVATTAAIHLPINARLERADASSTDDMQLWETTIARWHRFNHLRAAASVIACVLFVLALARLGS